MLKVASRLLVSILPLLFLFPNSLSAQIGSPAGPIPPEILEARRGRLLDLLGGARAVVASSSSRSIDGDYPQDSDYREHNDFFYLTGIEAPGAWLVLSGTGEDDVVLFLPPRVPGAEQWTGPKLGPGPEASSITGIRDVRSLEELGDDLRGWFGPGVRVGGAGERLFASLGNPEQLRVLDSAIDGSGLEVGEAAPIVARLRLVKDEEGLRRLRKAAQITMEAHREVWRVGAPGVTEYELEAALEYVFRASGAERLGFPSIVGSGPNGTVLHYDKSRRTLEDGDLIVVDIGAEFGYYTADITRTFPANGRFSPRQKALYDLVLGARNAALATIGPGVNLGDLTRSARVHFQENSGNLCGDDSCARYLIHGISHWLGMDVHDVGSGRSTLVPGMVLTIEPGLYLPDEQLGIRIEDDVLVTETGYEVLTEGLARTTEEIEAVMREEPRWVRRRGSGSDRETPERPGVR